LATPPGAEDVRTARLLAGAALRQGHAVSIFLNADGVLSATALSDLAAQGASLAACSLSARQRSVAPVEGVKWGSQLDWAEAVLDADRVIALA
jgi:sulfur relay (sulfurtransferase) complex TusBCD TusD component (DsrE family)